MYLNPSNTLNYLQLAWKDDGANMCYTTVCDVIIQTVVEILISLGSSRHLQCECLLLCLLFWASYIVSEKKLARLGHNSSDLF